MAPTREALSAGIGEIVRTLWREGTPFVRSRLWCIFALVIEAAVLTALGPVLLRCIVNGVTGNGRDPSRSVLLLVTLYVLTLWLGRTSSEIRNLVFARVSQRIFRTLSERAFSHLMHLPLRFHFDRQTGAVSQTLDNGLEGLTLVLRHLVFTCLPVAVELVTVLVVLMRFVTPPFILLFFGAVVCYLTVFAYSAAPITRAARAASAARVDATAAVTDALLNYETVKYFSAEGVVEDRVTRALGRSESAWVGFYGRYARNGLMVAGIFAGFLAAAISCAIEEVRRGRMTLGDFVLINMYMLQLVRPIEMMGYAMQGLSQGVAMLEKLAHLFREPTEPALRYGTVGGCGAGCLAFQGVRVSYGGARRALENVSFRIAAGHTLGIVGPSGSGKSTVVRVLMRLLEPESGRVLVDDVPISAMALEDLRRSIAVVPQDTILFDDTLRYNIAFGRANATPHEIEEAARIAQLHEIVMTLPDGYDTLVGERGVKLSGGERQRVSIARAVLKSPRIYVFDEATSSLDSRTELEIMRSLRIISRLNTTLVITHRLSTVIHADEIVVLENGQIVEQGTHQALLRQNGRYAGLWNDQQSGAAVA